MGMNNVFYRGRGFLEGRYDDLRPGLRMNIIANPGITESQLSSGPSQCPRSTGVVLPSPTSTRCTGGPRGDLEALKAAAIVSGVAQALATIGRH